MARRTGGRNLFSKDRSKSRYERYKALSKRTRTVIHANIKEPTPPLPRPCAQLTLKYLSLPHNSLQALLPHRLPLPLALHLRFPPLLRSLVIWMYSCIVVCTTAKGSLRAVHSSFVIGTESAVRERLDRSWSVSSICPAVEFVEVERGLCGGCCCMETEDE